MFTVGKFEPLLLRVIKPNKVIKVKFISEKVMLYKCD